MTDQDPDESIEQERIHILALNRRAADEPDVRVTRDAGGLVVKAVVSAVFASQLKRTGLTTDDVAYLYVVDDAGAA